MRKRYLTVMILVLLAPACLFADIMQLGLNVGYALPYSDITSGKEADYLDLKNFNLAPELRFNIFFLQLDAVSALSIDDNFFQADTQLTLGLEFKILNAIRIGAGAGVSMPIQNIDGRWLVSGRPFSDFADAMANSRMIYKVSLGLPINYFELTANWMIPAGGSFNERAFTPDIDQSRFSIGFLLTLF